MAVVSAGDGASILIRATVGELGSANWTNLFPVVAQRGGGKFCEPLVPAPVEWAGMEGVVQVIESGGEGLSYQVGAFYFISLVVIVSFCLISYAFIISNFTPSFFWGLVTNCGVCLLGVPHTFFPYTYIHIYISHNNHPTNTPPVCPRRLPRHPRRLHHNPLQQRHRRNRPLRRGPPPPLRRPPNGGLHCNKSVCADRDGVWACAGGDSAGDWGGGGKGESGGRGAGGGFGGGGAGGGVIELGGEGVNRYPGF